MTHLETVTIQGPTMERKKCLEERVLAKMREREIKDFSPEEINRVFRGLVSPASCKRILRWMRGEGLTIEGIFKESGERTDFHALAAERGYMEE